MSQKRRIEIEINEQPENHVHTYRYQYARTQNIKLEMSEDCARVTILMTCKSDARGFSDYPHFFDALYKASFSHILIFGKSIQPSRVTINIDETDEYTVYDKHDAIGINPLAYSLFIENRITIPERLRSDEVIDVVVNTARTSHSDRSDIKDDKEIAMRKTKSARMAALTAFVLAKTRTSSSPIDRYDRFVFLWMAMNGFYNSFLFDQFQAEEIDNLKSIREKSQIEYCLKMYKLGNESVNRANGVEAWEKAVLCFSGLPEPLPNDLFDDAEFVICFDSLTEWLAQKYKGLTLEGYLTFCLPYYLRCAYFHGDRTPPVFVHDKEARYRGMNLCSHILERFLDEHLHEIFAPTHIEKRN